MFKMRPVLIAIAFALSASAAHAANLPNGVVYSANEGDGSISEITLSTGDVRTAQIAVLPHNVQISPDGKTLLAVGTSVAKTGGQGAHGGEGKAANHGNADSTFILPLPTSSASSRSIDFARAPSYLRR